MERFSANIDKTAVVTGASSGIGLAVARMLTKEGYKVIGIGRKFRCDDIFEKIENDLTDDNKTDKLIRRILEDNKVYMLVNCAGVGFYGLHESLLREDIRNMVRTNLEIPLVLTNAFLPSIRQEKGWIINISSVTQGRVNTHGAAYGATKAGLGSFGESLFEEYRKQGVKVVNIRPDMTRTELYRNADFECSEDEGAYLLPEDTAEAIKDLLHMRDGVIIRDLTITPQYHRISKKTHQE